MSCFLQAGCEEGRLDEAQAFFIAGSSNRQIIENISYNIILATYTNLENDTRTLDQAAQNFAVAPDNAKLEQMRSAWLQSRISMKQAEMYFYGPNSNLFVDANLDCWVRGTSRCNEVSDCGTSVDGILASADAINSATLASRGAGVRGLSAIEYLLYDNGSGANDIDSIRIALSGRRLNYLLAAIADALRTAGQLKAGWDPTGQDFARQLASAGAGSSQYPKLLDGLSIIISGMLTQLESIRDKKIGYAAGFTLKSGGSLHLADVESPYSANSLVEILIALESVEDLYYGRYGLHQGPGFTDSVQRINEDLDTDIKTRFRLLKDRINTLKDAHIDLPTVIINDRNALRLVYDDLQSLRIIMATDLVSVSGTSPGISPNDGD